MTTDDPPLVTASVTLRRPEFSDRELVLPIRISGEWNVGDRHGRLSGDQELVISGGELGALRDRIEAALAAGTERDGTTGADDARDG